MRPQSVVGNVRRLASILAAMGSEARLRIMQLLLGAHPQGMVVNDLQRRLGIPASTLSHHLEKLKSRNLVRVRREHTCLRYTANTDTLQELLAFLYAECCPDSRAVASGDIVQVLTESGTPLTRPTPLRFRH